jgi:hypothetical protein
MPLQPAQLPHQSKKVAQFSNKIQVHSAYVMPIVHAQVLTGHGVGIGTEFHSTRSTSNAISVMSPSPMNEVDILSEEGIYLNMMSSRIESVLEESETKLP